VNISLDTIDPEKYRWITRGGDLREVLEGIDAAEAAGLPLQRSAHTGALTDLSYIQFMGPDGVACLDVGFPMRYSHSALEVVDTTDLEALARLLDVGLDRITPDLQLTRGP
jgi:putative aminopeptidase FrvX